VSTKDFLPGETEGSEVRYEYLPDISRLTKAFDAECLAQVPACTEPLVEIEYERGNPTTVQLRSANPGEPKAMTGIDYDEKGRPIRIVDAEDDPLDPRHEVVLTYDDAGQGNLATIEQHSTVPPVTLTTRLSYGPAGELLAVVDAEGRRTEFGYDLAGRLTLVRDADLEETFLGYDAGGKAFDRFYWINFASVEAHSSIHHGSDGERGRGFSSRLWRSSFQLGMNVRRAWP
jgi:YD repeat-containing protein